MLDDPKGRRGWVNSRLARITMGGPKAAQASTIGFVLVGPMIGGFLLGWWLDQKLGTQFWVLILGLLGVVGGFRELFATLKKMTPDKFERTPPPGRDTITQKAPPVPEVLETLPRKRLFSVPPPFPESEANEPKSAPKSAHEVFKELLDEDEESSGDAR